MYMCEGVYMYVYLGTYKHAKRGGLGRGWMIVVIRGMCVGS